MERIRAGYRAYTGHVFSADQAAAYNMAAARAERCPNDANRNAAHNLFASIAATPGAPSLPKFIKTLDGIWPLFISECSRIYVTQYARGDWRWTVYYGHIGQMKRASGKATNCRAAKLAAAAAA